MYTSRRAPLSLRFSIALWSTLCTSVSAQSTDAPLGERLLSLFESHAVVSETPHPAVARIIVPEGNAFAYGSGTLVDAHEQVGLVVTNWRVVSGGRGQIRVRFPDGFESPAQVLKTDRDWDLAALAIRRPNVPPVRLATQTPQPGETLTIAGYGSGNYRAISGPCTQYVSPGDAFPFEMVELQARARQGDSGGPILNARGELAGVLFGEGGGNTSGSHCGRVHLFLTGLQAPAPFVAPTQQVALTSTRPPVVSSIVPQLDSASPAPLTPIHRSSVSPTVSPTQDAVSSIGTPPISSSGWRASTSRDVATAFYPSSTHDLAPNYTPATASQDEVDWQWLQSLLGHNQGDRIKTILAGIGVIMMVWHTHRWVSSA